MGRRWGYSLHLGDADPSLRVYLAYEVEYGGVAMTYTCRVCGESFTWAEVRDELEDWLDVVDMHGLESCPEWVQAVYAAEICVECASR